MSRLWVKVIRKNRIDTDLAVPCQWGDQHEVLREALQEMDLPVPMWLGKHEVEFEQYRKTSFLPDHFVEDVDFQRLEADFLEDTDVKRKSRDPRNDFGGAW